MSGSASNIGGDMIGKGVEKWNSRERRGTCSQCKVK